MQETITFTTPGGHTVVIKGYLTGRVEAALKQIIRGDIMVSVDPNTGDTENVQVPLSVQDKATEKAIELLVISVDGVSEGVLDKVLDLPASETDYIAAEVNKITKGTFTEKKSLPSSESTSLPSATVQGT